MGTAVFHKQGTMYEDLKKRTKARYRAMAALARKYPNVYAKLLDDEREKLGLPRLANLDYGEKIEEKI